MVTNVTGWNELFNGSIVNAPLTMFNESLSGWFIPIMFVMFEVIIITKTDSPAMVFVTSIFFTIFCATILHMTATNPAIWMGTLFSVFSIAVMFYQWAKSS